MVAAGSMGLYLVVKVLWVASAVLLGSEPSGWGTGEWVTLNLVTVAMAAVGVAAGLAVAQPWGQRIPAALVVVPLWLGTGFLVSLIPFMGVTAVVRSLDGGSAEASSPSSDLPGWESVVLSLGFAGMALGLVVGVPLYLRERWPQTWSTDPISLPDDHRLVSGVAGVALAVLAGARLALAAGSHWGLKPGVTHVDLEGRAMAATMGLWCALASLAALRAARTGRAGRLSRVCLFVAAGALVAWGSWLLMIRSWQPVDFSTPQVTGLAVGLDAAGVVTGLLVAMILVRNLRAPRR